MLITIEAIVSDRMHIRQSYNYLVLYNYSLYCLHLNSPFADCSKNKLGSENLSTERRIQPVAIYTHSGYIKAGRNDGCAGIPIHRSPGF
jgi:hypothetical protein